MVEGSCVPNFRSVSFFVVGKRRSTNTQTPRPTYLQVKIVISSTGCSPPVDFVIFLILRIVDGYNFNPIIANFTLLCFGFIYRNEAVKYQS